MLTLSIVWVYVKKYWQIIAIIIAFIAGMLLFNVKNGDSIAKLLEESKKRHNDEVEAIKKAYEDELANKEQAYKKLQEVLSIIEQQYSFAQKKLDDKKKEEIKKIIEDTKNDPAELAKRLQESTGFEIQLPL